MIIQKKVNPDQEVNQIGWTPLYIAAQNGHTEVVKALLQYSKDPDHQEKQKKWSALHVAISFGHKDVVQVLIDTGCDINLKTGDGLNALQLAQAKNQTEIAKILQVAVLRSNQEVKIHMGESPTAVVATTATLNELKEDSSKTPLSQCSMFSSKRSSVISSSNEDKQKLQELISSIQKDLKDYKKQQNLFDAFFSLKTPLSENADRTFESLIVKLNKPDADIIKIFNDCKEIIKNVEKNNYAIDKNGGKFAKVIEGVKEKIDTCGSLLPTSPVPKEP